MTPTPLAAVVMAGGLGTRMRSRRPKHLHPLLGKRLVDWVLDAVRPLAPDPLVLVSGVGSEAEFRSTLPAGIEIAIQREPRGTGDAVGAARGLLADFDGDILVLSGDTPLLTTALLEELLAEHRSRPAAVTVLAFEPADPGSYGRILRDEAGGLRAIVEAADAAHDELAVREANSSIYVFSAVPLWDGLARLDTNNAQGELYLTEAVRQIVASGLAAAVYLAPEPVEAEGVNTRLELAHAAAALRDRILGAHMAAGVSVVDPATTWVDPDVVIERDAVLHPFTVLRGRSVIRSDAEVGPHVVAVDAEIGEGALVGPFCYLRPGTRLEARAKAGTFVEMKNSRIGEGTKVPHLSYIGDAEIGAGTNIGAGAITVNFPHQPGRPKGRTTIGRNVRTGVHNAFEAPVTIGDNSWIGGGSYITDDVPPDSLAIARERQVTKEGYVSGKRGD